MQNSGNIMRNEDDFAFALRTGGERRKLMSQPGMRWSSIGGGEHCMTVGATGNVIRL